MIKFVGVEQIDRVIRQLPKQLTDRTLQSIHAEAMKPFLKAAYYAAPLLSGGTADSIGAQKVSVKRSGVLGTVRGGPRRGRYKGNVAHLSEYGTRQRRTRSGANRGRMRAKPFIEPSWERTQRRVREGIRVATGKVITNFVKRTAKR